MNFNTGNITLVTLYGYFEDNHSQNPRHIQIPVDPQVQGELKGMLTDTVTRLGLPAIEPNMQSFDPAEKYGSEEQLKISLATPYLQGLASVVALRNLPSRLLKYYPYGRTCSAAASAFVAAVSVF